MSHTAEDIVNWGTFAETRTVLGEAFVRVLGYFREDGIKSVAAIEQAMRERDSAKLVLPSHTLKGESWQFGAERLQRLPRKSKSPPAIMSKSGRAQKSWSKKSSSSALCSRQL
jgi:hypothetical protein